MGPWCRGPRREVLLRDRCALAASIVTATSSDHVVTGHSNRVAAVTAVVVRRFIGQAANGSSTASSTAWARIAVTAIILVVKERICPDNRSEVETKMLVRR